MSKGQIFSSDLIAATAVFLILLAFASYIWDDSTDNIQRRLEVNEIKHLALSISDTLVMTSGTPYDWVDNPGAANSIGLVNHPRQISQKRWATFSTLSYDEQKGLLGVGRFEFWIGIKSKTGALLNSTGEFPTGDYRIGILRPVTYRGESRNLNFIIWEDYLTPSIIQQSNFLT